MAAKMMVLYTTWPDASTPEQAAQILLKERLIACANILAPMRSVFRWQGAVQRDEETPVLFKTSAERAGEAARRIAGLHPYEEPCIIALPVDSAASAPGFLAWVDAQTRG